MAEELAQFRKETEARLLEVCVNVLVVEEQAPERLCQTLNELIFLKFKKDGVLVKSNFQPMPVQLTPSPVINPLAFSALQQPPPNPLALSVLEQPQNPFDP